MVLLPEHALYVPVCYAQPPGSLCLPADLGSPAGLSDLPAIHSVAAVPGERQTALSSQADCLAAAAPDALLHVAVVEPVAALAVSMTVAVALTVAAPAALLPVAVVEPVAALAVSMTVAVALTAAAPDALLTVAAPVVSMTVAAPDALLTVAVALTVAAPPDALLTVAVVPAVEKMHLPLWTLTQFRSLQQSEQYFDERIDRPLVL